MLSLLIVDDEVIIADGLYQMLQEAFAEQLAVRRCYSFYEAQRVLETCRIDILMTDIEMPDVSGLELHRWASERWPMLRVIYLTGYSDFSYAHRALRQHALAYVLKSEGDQVIIEAVQSAIDSFSAQSVLLLAQMNKQRRRAERAHQLVYHAWHGGEVTAAQLEQAFAQSGAPFRVDEPVLMAYCYFESGVESLAQSMNLIEDLAGGRLRLLLTEMTARALLLIGQPSAQQDMGALRGVLESAQAVLEKQSALMTVCLLDGPVDWSEIGAVGEAMLERINRTGPADGELLTLRADAARRAQPPLPPGEWGKALDSLKRLNEYLLTGQRDLYAGEERELWAWADYPAGRHQARAVSGALAMSLLHCARDLPDNERICRRLEEICNARQSVRDAPEELHSLAERIFEIRGHNRSNRQARLVREVDAYVAAHMDGDLSLTTIADAVHFHPVYLSRIYKEQKGEPLSESIAALRLETACERLRTTGDSVSAVAAATGFASPNYFSRWFRKRTGFTPQEYREQRGR